MINHKGILGYSMSLSDILRAGGFYNKDGTWNSLLKIDGKLLRGRVETLVIKKKEQQVFMHIKNYNKKLYRLPGGSFENGVTNIVQAENEVNEEARIKVKNITNSMIHYTRLYSRPIELIDRELIDWEGNYNEVYVAEYDGPYEGDIKRVDIDQDMYEKGKFYDLYHVYSILNEAHKQVIDSIFPDIKLSEIDESVILLGESNNEVHYYPYYTPYEMDKLGVFNENENRYSTIDDDAIDWYHEYVNTLQNPDSENWYKELQYRYNNYIDEPTFENKQLVLNLGWNPEVQVTYENVLIASENTRKRLENFDINEPIMIDENIIFDKKDIVFNLDKWDSGQCNIIFITGLSGSGKSTMANELAEQYDAKILRLDYFQNYYEIKNSNMSYNRWNNNTMLYLIDEYLKTHPKIKKDIANFSSLDLESFQQYFLPFFVWLVLKVQKNKNERYIIDGIHILLYVPYKDIKEYPLICINTSMIKSLVRHWLRDDWTIKDIVNHGYEDLVRFKRWNDSYEDFYDSMNEGAVYDPFSKSTVSTAIGKNDYILTCKMIQSKLDAHHKNGNLLDIKNRDIESDDGGFVFAEYLIDDSNSKDVMEFIDRMNGIIEHSIYVGEIERPESIGKGLLILKDVNGFLN